MHSNSYKCRYVFSRGDHLVLLENQAKIKHQPKTEIRF